MYRFIVFPLVLCAFVLAQEQMKIMENCGRLIHPKGLSCCTKKYIPTSITEELKECMQVPGKPPSCEREICMAKKKGYASDDGTIDKAKLKEFLEKNSSGNSDLQKAIIEDCVDGDSSEYGPPDFCDLMKLNTCMHLHFVVDCPDWNNDDACAGSSEAAMRCIKLLTK